MKKKLIVLGAIAILLGLAGCQNSNDVNGPVVTDAPVAPTVTVAPTKEVLEPTNAVVEPTKEVVELTKEVEPTVAPTKEPEVTEVPLLSPEPVITEEPEVTPAFSLTVVPTPTETPVATEEPEPTPTEEPEPTATVAPTPKPTEQPTATPKPKATATPKPTNKPKATATPKPTSSKVTYNSSHLNTSAKKYKFLTEELGLPGDIEDYVYYNKTMEWYSMERPSLGDDDGEAVDKILYAKGDTLASESMEQFVEVLYGHILDSCDWQIHSIEEQNQNYDFENFVEVDMYFAKGQELHVTRYYPEWNIYKVEYHGTYSNGTPMEREYHVFGGQVSEKKPSGLGEHPYLFVELENGEYVVTGLADTSVKNIEIPSEIDGIPVTRIAHDAFSCDKKYGLKSVVLGDNITEIGRRAFYEADVEIKNLPNSIKTIGEEAFKYSGVGRNEGMKARKLPSSLENIGNGAFNDAYAEFESLPQSVKEIGEDAFGTCTINKVEIPKEMTVVTKNAFHWCTIKELKLHDDITRIETMALSELDLGEEVDITLPKKLTYIGADGIWGNYGGIKLQGKMPEHYFELHGDMERAVEDIVSGWEKKYGKLSDLEYTLLVYDWMRKNVVNDHKGYLNTPDIDTSTAEGYDKLVDTVGRTLSDGGEVLLLGDGFCGPKAAIHLLLERCGVESYYADGPSHVWNIVVIDGKQYNLDPEFGQLLVSDKEYQEYKYPETKDPWTGKSEGYDVYDNEANVETFKLYHKYDGKIEYVKKDSGHGLWLVTEEEYFANKDKWFTTYAEWLERNDDIDAVYYTTEKYMALGSGLVSCYGDASYCGYNCTRPPEEHTITHGVAGIKDIEFVLLMIPSDCPKSFSRDEIASAKARLGLK